MPGHYSTNNNKNALEVPPRITCVRGSHRRMIICIGWPFQTLILLHLLRILHIVSNRQNQLCETKEEIPDTFYSLGLLHHLFKSLS